MKRGTLITADSSRSLMRLEFTGDYLFLPASGQFRLTDGAQTGPQLVAWFRVWAVRSSGRNLKTSIGNGAKNTVAAESLQNTGADIEKTAVKLKRPGADRARDPWESHQIFERKPD
jgi:hypothetical protein